MKYAPFVLILCLLSLVLAAACGGSDSPPAETPVATETGPEPPTEGAPADASIPDPVAVVNGQPIAKSDFERQISQLEVGYAQQGIPFPQGAELDQLRQQTVRQLVQRELVLQESDARGITANDEEVAAQFEAAVASFPDEETFDQTLEAEGLTRTDVEGLIAEGIKITKLLDAVVQEANLPAPTEDELRGLYDEISQQQQLPPFEQVKEQIAAEVMAQQEDAVVQAFVQELEAEGTVEVRLGS